MQDKIKRDRQLLKISFAIMCCLLLVFTWLSIDKTTVKYLGKAFFAVMYAAIIITFILSAVYVYKMYKWYDSPMSPPWLMVLLYVVPIFSKFFSISIIIGIITIWKTRKLVAQKEQ